MTHLKAITVRECYLPLFQEGAVFLKAFNSELPTSVEHGETGRVGCDLYTCTCTGEEEPARGEIYI